MFSQRQERDVRHDRQICGGDRAEPPNADVRDVRKIKKEINQIDAT